MAFAHPVVKRDLAQLETGLAAVGIHQPLFVGQRDVVAEHLLVGLNDLFGDLLAVDVERRQADQLLLTFAGQQLHRAVAAGELFVFVAVVDQIRRGIEEGTQQRRLLAQLNLRQLALFHLFGQLFHHLQALFFRLDTVGNLLIQLADIVFELLIELQIAVAHLFELVHQPRQPLARLFQLFHHHREKIDRPRGDQQAEEDRTHHVDAFHFAAQQHGHRHLHHHRQHHQRRGQQQREAYQPQFHH